MSEIQSEEILLYSASYYSAINTQSSPFNNEYLMNINNHLKLLNFFLKGSYFFIFLELWQLK